MKEKKFPLASGFIRAKMVRSIRLAALEGLGVDAESSGRRREKQEVLVQPIIGRPASSSSLSSCVWCFKKKTFTYSSRPRRPLSFCLKNVIDKCVENSIWFSFLVVLALCWLYYFSSGLLWGGDDGCVGAGRDGGFVFCRQLFQQYFLSHSHFTVFVAAKSFPRGWKEGWSTF